ncbi:hypothetical protein [Paraburkholderia youngii]|uniref:hypothetical protein n=1 Tax=Paraburkholderia youngii TaxID=2782701 RepID=UPI001C37E1C9|nr:hypothetical protein [Paraburkholderia youngii]
MSKKIEELQTEDVKSLVRDKLTKPRVAAADAVVAILFEVAEKLENKLRVKMFDSEIARLLVQTLICKGSGRSERPSCGCQPSPSSHAPQRRRT